jgi:hypothetical protein
MNMKKIVTIGNLINIIEVISVVLIFVAIPVLSVIPGFLTPEMRGGIVGLGIPTALISGIALVLRHSNNQMQALEKRIETLERR